MAKKKSRASKREIQEIADEFFPGSRVLDEKAFEKAMRELDAEDRQFLQDLRDAAFEHENMDDVIQELERDRATRRRRKKRNKPNSESRPTAN